MITKAIVIPSTTIEPATKLDIKFANEGVIYRIPCYFNNNKVNNSNIDYTTYCSQLFQKNLTIIII